MGIMDSLQNLPPAAKIGGVAALGLGTFLMFKGGGASAPLGGMPDGTVVLPGADPDAYSNTPGSEWGGDGYQYFAEVNAQNMELLRYMEMNRHREIPGVPVPVPPGVIPPPGTIPPPQGEPGRRGQILGWRDRMRANTGLVQGFRQDGVTEHERGRVDRLGSSTTRLRGLIQAARPDVIPIQTTTVKPPTTRPPRV